MLSAHIEPPNSDEQSSTGNDWNGLKWEPLTNEARLCYFGQTIKDYNVYFRWIRMCHCAAFLVVFSLHCNKCKTVAKACCDNEEVIWTTRTKQLTNPSEWCLQTLRNTTNLKVVIKLRILMAIWNCPPQNLLHFWRQNLCENGENAQK